MSSARPSSLRRSSVAGCVVAARGSACGASFSSNRRTGRPSRPNRQAHSSPTGPPPAINTRRSSTLIRTSPHPGTRHSGAPAKPASPESILRDVSGYGFRARRCAPSRNDAGQGPTSLLLALVVIVDLVEHAAFLGLEGAVMDAGRTARIGRRLERLAALALRVVADDQIAGDEIDLLPVIVHEGRGGVGAGLELQEPRAAAHLLRLVEIARQDLLRDAGRIAGRRVPAVLHVDAGELDVRLVHRHVCFSNRK